MHSAQRRACGGGREAFFASHTLQDATLRNLQTLSESSQRLSESLKSAYPQIPWTGISGFRNILVHNYLGIDLENVWAIVERDVPPFRQAVQEMIDKKSFDAG